MTTVRLPDAPVTAGEIVYPESDGLPMGETELHRDETVDLILMLQWHFRDQAEVHVGGDLFVYYEEGDPTKVFCPDVFVVFGVGKDQLRTYKVWKLGPAPTIVIEVSSRKTWRSTTSTTRSRTIWTRPSRASGSSAVRTERLNRTGTAG